MGGTLPADGVRVDFRNFGDGTKWPDSHVGITFNQATGVLQDFVEPLDLIDFLMRLWGKCVCWRKLDDKRRSMDEKVSIALCCTLISSATLAGLRNDTKNNASSSSAMCNAQSH